MSVSTRFPRLNSNGRPARKSQLSVNDKSSQKWILGLLVIQVACQLGLLFESLAPFRVFFRVGAFSFTLLALAFVQTQHNSRKHHPSFWFQIFCLGVIALQILNPTSNTVASCIATLVFNIALVAALFWVPRIEVSTKLIRTTCIVLWSFHLLSSCFGVLQVYFPGQFQPAVSQSIRDSVYGTDSLKVTLASGEDVLRPMGLTDVPGGASSAGMYAFIFGLGLMSIIRSPLWGILGLIGLPIGLFCIYLSQVRAVLVLVIIVTICYSIVLAATRRYSAAARVAFIVPIVAATAFIWALALGGESTLARFETLVAENPAEVFNKNRGGFLYSTFENQLPEYPFGAGLGRWGTISGYFSDSSLADSQGIWVEIQWTAWAVDGGILLMTGYVIALIVAIGTTWQIAFRSRDNELAGWALLILAYDVSVIALTFSFVPFHSQGGLEFWLLNTMIFAADQTNKRRAAWQVG
ncbi:hypothetical protein BH11PLA2_BH11PLA2_26740 [soil metagenome]